MHIYLQYEIYNKEMNFSQCQQEKKIDFNEIIDWKSHKITE